jgi:hypothetical protein
MLNQAASSKLPMRYLLTVLLILSSWVFRSGAEDAPQLGLSPVIGEATVTLTLAEEILAAAKLQVQNAAWYRMAYPRIPFPAGDTTPYEALCCDVIIRSFRAAGIDLQELVFEDARNNVPPIQTAGMTGFSPVPDPSWAHRRTAYLDGFFRRNALSVSLKPSLDKGDWQPGDVVIFKRDGWETWHVALISDSTDDRTHQPRLIDAWADPGFVSDTHTLDQFGLVGGHYRMTADFREKLPSEHQARARQAWADYTAAARAARVAKPKALRPGYAYGFWN